jgi:molybdenum cofactor biosynthesis enzyme MoaA
MANISALLALHRDMNATISPAAIDFQIAKDALGKALADELSTPKPTSGEFSATCNRIRMLLAGELFPPNRYTDKSGNERVWDDREFFEKMIKWNKEWSPAQMALIQKRLKYYDDNGHKLRKNSEPKTAAPTAPSLGVDSNLDVIPF